MFQAGELLVYGGTGVCRVVEVTVKDAAGPMPGGLYYCLRPLYQTGTIYTPAENPRVFIRPVISAEDALRLIDSIPAMRVQPFHTHSMQELREHYRAACAHHTCESLLQLALSIHAKKREAARSRRRLGQVDERYMKQSEALLFGELAVALGIEPAEVPGFITARVGALDTLLDRMAAG